jgi:ribose transport system permease protein
MTIPRLSLNLGLDRLSGLYLWAIFIIGFSVWQPSLFPTSVTAKSIASGQAVPAMLALALLIPLAAGVYDLSVGATINLSAVLAAILQAQHHWGMWTSILVTLAACLGIGVVNGILIVKLHIDSFIATLGMSTVIAAVQTILTKNTLPFAPTGNSWNSLTQRPVFGVQIVFVYMLILAVIVWWLLSHTPPGRYIYAVGGNIEAARLSGVRVDYYRYIVLILSALISGIAGIFFCSLLGPSLTFGPGLLLPAFAAAFLGSTQLTPGRFNVWGTLLAILVLATGVKGLQLVTGAQWLNDMFNGVALIVAVAFAIARQRATRLRVDREHHAELRGSAPNQVTGDATARQNGDPREPPIARSATGNHAGSSLIKFKKDRR